MISHVTSPGYTIERVYVKGASIEVPNMSRLPKTALQPVIKADMSVNTKQLSTGELECALKVSLHAAFNELTMFLIEVTQAGLFRLADNQQKNVDTFARSVAPGILFPYARKQLCTLAIQAGFQPIILDHVDFAPPLERAAYAHLRSANIAAVPTPERNIAVAEALKSRADESKPQATESSVPPDARGSAIPQRTTHFRSRLLAASIAAAVFAALGGLLWQMQADRYQPSRTSEGKTIRPSNDEMPLDALVSTSAKRLSEQDASAYTVDLGMVAVPAAQELLRHLKPDRPVYLLREIGGSLRILYGVFPTADLAAGSSDELGALPGKYGLKFNPLTIGSMPPAR